MDIFIYLNVYTDIYNLPVESVIGNNVNDQIRVYMDIYNLPIESEIGNNVDDQIGGT